MPAGLPCPNPRCTHVFPTAAVAGAATLRCPRCGTVFQLRPGAADPRRTVPVARPVAPLATPVAPTPVPPPAETTAVLFAPPDAVPPTVYRYRRGRRWRWIKALGWLVLLGAMVAGGVAAWPRIRAKLTPLIEDARRDEPSGPAGKTETFEKFNFKYVFPAKDWSDDDATRVALQANVALRRSDPAGWMALAFKDYRTRNPREGEVVDAAVAALSGYFENLEWQRADGGKLGGLPARRFLFQGEAAKKVMSGECQALAHQGVAYWLATWAPAGTEAALQGEFADLRARFGLLREREGWVEKQPATRATQK